MATAADSLQGLAARFDARRHGARAFTLRLWDGSIVPAAAEAPDTGVTLVVHSPEALAYVVQEPNELGLGRAWVSGGLDVEGDLETAIATLRDVTDWDGFHLGLSDRIAGMRALRALGVPARAPEPPASEARLGGRRHSIERDRAAVTYHYDVSNTFYRYVLGPTMVYSCAYFARPDEPLDIAQERKLDRVCRKLALAPDERLLDVGCGWGSLVLHAATRYGVRATGITLSEPQAALARERVAEAGLADRVRIEVADYRTFADEPYDAVASVGMVEHVGLDHLGEYFAALRRLLRPGGRLLNHGISKPTPRRAGRARPTFIGRYVFPDGELPPVPALLRDLEVAGLEVRDAESLREHYALTLRRWVDNLADHRDEAIAEAGAERERVWRLYMTACALAFDAGQISIHQVLATAPGAPHRLPLLRTHHHPEEPVTTVVPAATGG